jgi:predicted nuclease of predicted toxin-antitoxin system
MRFLADENVPVPTIRLLRQERMDVEAVREVAAGSSDEQVLEHARAAGQILITFDRDFGELVYHRGAAVPAGIVYLRLPQPDPEFAGRAILELARVSGLVLEGWFTVVDADRVRQRPLPTSR